MQIAEFQKVIVEQAFFKRELISKVYTRSMKTDTVFCWINASAWVNVPPTFDFDWLYVKNSWTIPTYC